MFCGSISKKERISLHFYLRHDRAEFVLIVWSYTFLMMSHTAGFNSFRSEDGVEHK